MTKWLSKSPEKQELHGCSVCVSSVKGVDFYPYSFNVYVNISYLFCFRPLKVRAMGLCDCQNDMSVACW